MTPPQREVDRVSLPSYTHTSSRAKVAGDKLQVYFTIDTETSMGGAWRNSSYAPVSPERTIFGKCGSGFYGIPLIMEILEQHGFRGTFFTEVFCSHNFGGEEVETVLHSIRRRGHDVQLHLHPEQRFYREYLQGGARREECLMFSFPPEEQVQLVRDGVELFRKLSGTSPRAYRAGCYGASEITLRALRLNGVQIDSSYNLAYLGSTCGFQAQGLNAPVIMEGIHEFPVTVFRVPGLGYKPLEISAVSVGEIMAAIRSLQREGCRHVVLCLHSFSLLKHSNVQYDRCRPDHFVIRRLKKLCRALVQLKDEIDVGVLGEAPLPEVSTDQPHHIPSVGLVRPSMRKICQAVNRFYWV